MRISKIEQVPPNPTFGGIKIINKENKEVRYLYNKLLDVVREERVGGLFANDYVTLNTEKPSVVQKLKEFGIKFIQDNK